MMFIGVVDMNGMYQSGAIYAGVVNGEFVNNINNEFNERERLDANTQFAEAEKRNRERLLECERGRDRLFNRVIQMSVAAGVIASGFLMRKYMFPDRKRDVHPNFPVIFCTLIGYTAGGVFKVMPYNSAFATYTFLMTMSVIVYAVHFIYSLYMYGKDTNQWIILGVMGHGFFNNLGYIVMIYNILIGEKNYKELYN